MKAKPFSIIGFNVERFWSKVQKLDSCWEWRGFIHPTGYGSFKLNSERVVYAHVLSYLLNNSKDPFHGEIDHLCRNRKCVNPAHLELVSKKENILRGNGPTAANARKTHCRKGHPLSGDNVRIESSGSRRCRACAGSRYIRRKPIKQSVALQ